MKKHLKIGLVAVVALMLGATMALADARSHFFVVNMPDIQEGQLYNRNVVQAQNPNPQPSSLPAPQDPDSGNDVSGPASGSKLGPTMFDGFSKIEGGLAPNIGIRGGGMMSTKQKADRQIKLLIRQLN